MLVFSDENHVYMFLWYTEALLLRQLLSYALPLPCIQAILLGPVLCWQVWLTIPDDVLPSR